jgi:hypothetical protein
MFIVPRQNQESESSFRSEMWDPYGRHSLRPNISLLKELRLVLAAAVAINVSLLTERSR